MGHSEFKIFKGKLTDIADIQQQIESFVASNKVSARSIGIEFIEHSKEVLLSLGYSKEGPHAPITLAMVSFGEISLEDTDAIEQMMSNAAKEQKNVICHEHCITDTNEFMMIFMSAR